VFVKHNFPLYDVWPWRMTLTLWGWPWPFTTQNVQLHEIHMHAKYPVAIFNIAKVMANIKAWCKQTNKQTGQKQYVPQYIPGDIKISIPYTKQQLIVRWFKHISSDTYDYKCEILIISVNFSVKQDVFVKHYVPYTCMPSIKLLSSILQTLWAMLKFSDGLKDTIYLTFDLEGWPWPFTTQNVQLNYKHIHANIK